MRVDGEERRLETGIEVFMFGGRGDEEELSEGEEVSLVRCFGSDVLEGEKVFLGGEVVSRVSIVEFS